MTQQPHFAIGISATTDGQVQFIASNGVAWAMDLDALRGHVAACLDAAELAALALQRKAAKAAKAATTAAPAAPSAPHNGANGAQALPAPPAL